MDVENAWEEHEDQVYRRQVFAGDIPRSAGNMSRLEYTWGTQSLQQRALMLALSVQSDSELARALSKLDPLRKKLTITDEEAYLRAELLEEMLKIHKIDLRDSPPFNYGLIEFDSESYSETKALRRKCWLELSITGGESDEATQGSSPSAVKACFREGMHSEFLFCYKCGHQIVISCGCSGSKDKLIFPSKLPKVLEPDAKVADHAEWHAQLLEKTEYATCARYAVSRWWGENLPIIAVVLQRYSAVLLAAAERYTTRMDFKDASTRVAADLGCSAGFPKLLKQIGITRQQQVKGYAVEAVRKLTCFQFAQLSLCELWLCNEAWEFAAAEGKLPAAAAEALKHFRGFMFSVLVMMFSFPWLAPDFRGIEDSNLKPAMYT